MVQNKDKKQLLKLVTLFDRSGWPYVRNKKNEHSISKQSPSQRYIYIYDKAFKYYLNL